VLRRAFYVHQSGIEARHGRERRARLEGVSHMSRQGADKRNKERARQQKQRDKAQDRVVRKREKDAKGDTPPGEDPDIAGIVPGPQPPLEE